MRTADVRWWAPRDVAARAADPRSLDELLTAAALVVDCRDGEPLPARSVLNRAACLVVALCPRDGDTPGADVVLRAGDPDTLLLGADAEEAARSLAAAAAAAPEATATLAQLLRATATLPVPDALAMESMAYSLLLTGSEFRRWLAVQPSRRHHEQPQPVLVHRDADEVTLTLNRPRVHNAYDAAMRDALVEALALPLADPVVRVVVQGSGPSFCSGGDLSEFGTSSDAVHAHGIRTTRSVGALLHELRDRCEVRVHGTCVGAGVELPAYAGHVVAAPGTTFRLPEVAMGLVPGAGGTVSLPRRIGVRRTLILAVSGMTLAATDALRWGLVDGIAACPPGESGVTA